MGVFFLGVFLFFGFLFLGWSEVSLHIEVFLGALISVFDIILVVIVLELKAAVLGHVNLLMSMNYSLIKSLCMPLPTLVL